MLKRYFAAFLCALLFLLSGASAETSSTPAPTPAPIFQYNMWDVLRRVVVQSPRMYFGSDDFFYTFSGELSSIGAVDFTLEPAEQERTQASLSLEGLGESIDLTLQFAPDALYIRQGENALSFSYADIISAFVPEQIDLPALSESESMQLANLSDQLYEELLRGAAVCSVSNNSVHFSTSTTQVLQMLTRCCDLLMQEQALLDELLARYIHPLIPEEYASYREYLCMDTLCQILDSTRSSLVYSHPLNVSFAANYDASQTQDRYCGSAKIYIPGEDSINLTFTAASVDPRDSTYAVQAQFSYGSFDRAEFVLDVEGTFNEEYIQLAFIPQGSEQFRVQLSMIIDSSTPSLLLDTPIGSLSMNGARNYQANTTDYTLQLSSYPLSADARLSLPRSRHLSQLPAFHLGVHHPQLTSSAFTGKMRYDYLTIDPNEGTLAVRIGDSLLGASTIPNTEYISPRNVMQLMFDADTSDDEPPRYAELVTAFVSNSTPRSVGVSQTLTTQDQTVAYWSLSYGPASNFAPAITDAQPIDLNTLIMLLEELIPQAPTPSVQSETVAPPN